MQNFIQNSLNKNSGSRSLGSSLYSWIYKPQKSNKWLFGLLSVLAVAVFFGYSYLDQILPWLKKVPAIVVYGVIMALGWFLQTLQKKGKDQEWILYEKGYKVIYLNKSGEGESRVGYWQDFKTCTYDEKSVKLITDTPFKGNVNIPVKTNVMEVYSLCRERISIAHSKKMYDSAPELQRPNTPEQRHLMRKERQERTD